MSISHAFVIVVLVILLITPFYYASLGYDYFIISRTSNIGVNLASRLPLVLVLVIIEVLVLYMYDSI